MSVRLSSLRLSTLYLAFLPSAIYDVITGVSRDVRFRLPVGQFGTKWDNSGAFKISFLFIWAHRAQMNSKLILKGHIFVPLGAKLTR